MKIQALSLLLVCLSSISQLVFAAPPPKLLENATSSADLWSPRFDYDTDGCYPSVGIGRDGQANGGLKPTGDISGNCHDLSDLINSNTNHRSTCLSSNGNQYCAHMYALYFEKDQAIDGALFDDAFSHRHDWEFVIVWLTNNTMTHVSYSKHRDVVTEPANAYVYDDSNNQHVRIVYHKDGASTHVFRPGDAGEIAENDTGAWHKPTLVSWSLMQGDSGVTNSDLKNLFNTTDFGNANTPFNDPNFINKLNAGLPSGYPAF
ncbi:NPP1 family protein [Catenovulum sp. 2E275]|uniref:NPP1 family protein n=1 Tax=Catenovulum sp. 2E275 TaxID=2980497 RepID=UPI0021D031A7|nr:NPP1 family protein [Catenovulum sp. 2E275]MCU4676675.1 NPP1 family protein [Catenovulum sp. 2E275]